MSVRRGATLGGTGSVGATTLNVGTIAPTGTGTLTVNGTYTQNAGSTYQVNVTPAGAKVAISGAATLNGGTVVVNGPTGFYGGKTYTIMSTTPNSLNGTFSGLVDNIPNTTAVLIYDPNTFVLLQINGGASPCRRRRSTRPRSETRFAAVNGNAAFNVALTTLTGLTTAQQNFTLDQLSGEVYASALSAGIENQALWLHTLAQHVRLANQCLCPAIGAGGASGCDGDGTWRSWATPSGQAGTNQGDGIRRFRRGQRPPRRR